MKPLSELTHRDFEPLEGQDFTLKDAGGEVPLKLVKVQGRAWNGPGRAPYSLLFAASTAINLPQRIYALEHPSEGEVELFLVPVGRDARGLLLEAVFN